MTEPIERNEYFEVFDALGGLFRLEPGEGTLAGSIPLRAARACTPFLEGNAFGYRVVTETVIRVRRRWGLWRLEAPFTDAVRRAQKAVMPQIAVQGISGAPASWSADADLLARLEQRLVWLEGAASAAPRVTLFTGWFVRRRVGCALLVGSGGNRRSLAYVTEPQRWTAEGFAPLLLQLTYRGDGEDWDITGELASLLPAPNPSALQPVHLRDARSVGAAHAEFFDAAYFASKKQGPTHKYKELLRRAPGAAASESVSDRSLSAVLEGGQWIRLSSSEPSQELEPARRDAPVTLLRNAVSFEARFDGQRVVVDCDQRELREHASQIEAEWSREYGDIESARGARFYFTKYATLHQIGEPYFFVKPPALVRTPPGTACLIEGLSGSGYDVLRGVVRTDVFHALPAVLRLNNPGRRVVVPRGAPLAWVMAFDRQRSVGHAP